MSSPTTKPRPSVITQRLRNQGFDLTRYNRESQTWRPRCSQCSALVINGVPCHETGCPNQRRSRD